MKVRSALDALKRARRPYLVLRLVYYGLIAWTMVYVSCDRTIQQRFGQVLLDTLGSGPLATVIDAFSAGQALRTVGLIFAINLIGATLFTITLPSLIVPFSGLLLFGVRALLWGILFAPQFDAVGGVWDVLAGLGVLGLILLEGEGYILGAVGAYVQGRALLWPRWCTNSSSAARLASASSTSFAWWVKKITCVLRDNSANTRRVARARSSSKWIRMSSTTNGIGSC